MPLLPDPDLKSLAFTVEELAEILAEVEIEITVGAIGVGLVNAESMAAHIIRELEKLNA